MYGAEVGVHGEGPGYRSRVVELSAEEKTRTFQKQRPGTWKIARIIKWQESKDKDRKINSKQNKQKPGVSQEGWSLASAGILLSSWHRKASAPLSLKDGEVPRYPPTCYTLEKVHLLSFPRNITNRFPSSRGCALNFTLHCGPRDREQIPFSPVI